MKKERLEAKEIYTAPVMEVWTASSGLHLLSTLSADLYLEGEIDGYEDIDEY